MNDNPNTTLRKCSCQHEYQDKKYGKGWRVHNFARFHPEKVRGGWRCTVCKDVKGA